MTIEFRLASPAKLKDCRKIPVLGPYTPEGEYYKGKPYGRVSPQKLGELRLLQTRVRNPILHFCSRENYFGQEAAIGGRL